MPAKSQNGQPMGAKGRNTRLRLMAATADLLATHTVSELRVADIAAASGTSPAVFYRYFADASEAALAVVESFPQSTDDLLRLASADWPQASATARAEQFVEAYIDTWRQHEAVLHKRNLAAEAGDERFLAARERGVRPLQDALGARISRGQREGHLPGDLVPSATAGALIALLERIAAVSRRRTAQDDITHAALAKATAFILRQVLPTRS